MKFIGLFTLLVTLLITGCDSTTSQTSSNSAKILDAGVVKDINVLYEKPLQEMERIESRLPEVINAMNEVLIKANEEERTELQELLNLQMMVFQEKGHLDGESSRMTTQLLDMAANAGSKEQFMTDANQLIKEYSRNVERFMDSYNNFLVGLQSADLENPIIRDILSEMGEGVEGEEAPNEPQP